MLALWGGLGLQGWGSEEVAVPGGVESFCQPSSLLPFSLHRVAMPAFSYRSRVLLLLQHASSWGAAEIPGQRVPGHPVLLGAQTWPPGTACGDRDMGHQGQEMLLARVGPSSLAPFQHHGVFLPFAAPWGGSWSCPQPCFCVSVPTLLMLISPGVPLLPLLGR